MIPIVCKIAQKWKSRHQENPRSSHMAHAADGFHRVVQGVTCSSADVPVHPCLKRGGQGYQEGHWTFLSWNQEVQKHEVIEGRSGFHDSAGAGVHRVGQGAPRVAEVQPYPTTCSRHDRKTRDLSLLFEATLGIPSVPKKILAGSGSPATHRTAPAAFTALPAGSKGAGEALRKPQLLKLHHADHHCYSQCRDSRAVLGLQPLRRHRSGLPVQGQAGAASCHLRGWHHGGQQHDAHEFLLFLAPSLQAGWMQQGWEARRLDPKLRSTLSLDIPVQPHTHLLQNRVAMWHQQASIHALTTTSHVLVVQLMRYVIHSGDCAKLGTRVVVQPGQTIYFPEFCEDAHYVARPDIVMDVTIHRTLPKRSVPCWGALVGSLGHGRWQSRGKSYC